MTEFKQKVTRGVRWTGINTACVTALHLVELAVLARLLGAEAYGLMAIVSVVTGFAGVFSDLGLSSAVIQRKSPTREELSTLYWINVLAGSITFTLFVLAAPLVATAFGLPQLKQLLAAAALSFVIASFGTQFTALIHKDLRFDIVTKFDIASSLVGMTVSILLALHDFGVWALVFGSLSATFSLTIMRVVWAKTTDKLPLFHFNWADKRGYLSFGIYRAAALFVNQLNSRIDQLLIGSLLGPVALGYYNIAFRLVIAPITKINSVLTIVAFPAFSSVQDRKDLLKNGFMKMIGWVTSANAPILVGIAAVAPLLVPIFLGEKWRPSIPLVQILAFYSLLRSFGNAAGSLIVAKGKANWTFYWNLSLTLLIPPTIFVAAKTGGIVNICYSLVVLHFVHFLLHYRVFIRNLLGPCFIEYVVVIAKPSVLALCMGALMWLILRFAPTNTVVTLLLAVTFGLCAYSILSVVFQRALVREAISLLFGGSRRESS